MQEVTPPPCKSSQPTLVQRLSDDKQYMRQYIRCIVAIIRFFINTINTREVVAPYGSKEWRDVRR